MATICSALLSSMRNNFYYDQINKGTKFKLFKDIVLTT